MDELYISEDVGAMRRRKLSPLMRKRLARLMRARMRRKRMRMGEVPISGLEHLAINGIGRRGRNKKGNIFKRAANSVKAGAKKVQARAKKVAKGAGKLAKKGFKLLKKGALAAPRNAFLLLVKVNFRGFATKLSKSNQGELFTLWEKIGGKPSALKKVIDSAKNKKRILGIGATIYTPLGGIGGVGAVTVASAMASAASVVALLKKFLPKNAKDDTNPEEQAQGENLAQSIESGTETKEQLEEVSTKTLTTKSGERVQAPDIEEQENEKSEYKATRSGGGAKRKAQASESEESESTNGGNSGMSTGLKVGIGVAVAGAFFLAMKKK